MTVLLWGRAGEPIVEAVARACGRLGVEALAVDGDELLSVDMCGGMALRDGRRIDLGSVSGVLVRPSGRAQSPEGLQACRALHAWTELTTVTVLNRLSAASSNHSKPYQLGQIAESGFAVPETLVTTDPDDVREFCAEYDPVVYKSISGVRSIVAVLNPADEDRLTNISTCPTQFQQYVGGTDHRVHVVGGLVFACRVDSTAIDYRYAEQADGLTALTAVKLSDDIADRCMALTKSLSLGLAGIDLRLDGQGTWWCFEVNTAPGFTWFEEQTGLPIADAVAKMLRGPR